MRRLSAALLVPLLLLSGCMGGSSDASDEPVDTEPASDSPSPSPTDTVPPDTFDPKFHLHDYWAGRDKVQLYEGDLQIGQDAVQESFVESDSFNLGVVEFDTKRDGDDSGLSSGKTDVVYQGTSHMEVKVTWTDANKIPGIEFWYKHASTPIFTSMGPVQTGQTYRIDLGAGWADMPHQLSLSRWRFKVEAFNPATRDYPIKANYAQGTVRVEMWIFNSFGRIIDPPHPYFFTNGTSRYAGEVNATLANCVVVNETRAADARALNPVGLSCPHSQGALGFAVEPPHIIPWETTKAVLQLWYNYTSSSPGSNLPIALGLKFHGADKPVYLYPRAVTTAKGYARYEVSVPEIMTDTPYSTVSDWRFGVFPIVNGNSDVGGEFSGVIHIHVTAIKEGDTSNRGMGN